MSLRIHIVLNQSQIKALSGKKFHQTCLPGSTLSNMLFIPLFVLCVHCECVLSSKYTHAGTLYTRDQTVSLAVDQPSTLSAVVEALFVALFH